MPLRALRCRFHRFCSNKQHARPRISDCSCYHCTLEATQVGTLEDYHLPGSSWGRISDFHGYERYVDMKLLGRCKLLRDTVLTYCLESGQLIAGPRRAEQLRRYHVRCMYVFLTPIMSLTSAKLNYQTPTYHTGKNLIGSAHAPTDS